MASGMKSRSSGVVVRISAAHAECQEYRVRGGIWTLTYYIWQEAGNFVKWHEKPVIRGGCENFSHLCRVAGIYGKRREINLNIRYVGRGRKLWQVAWKVGGLESLWDFKGVMQSGSKIRQETGNLYDKWQGTLASGMKSEIYHTTFKLRYFH